MSRHPRSLRNARSLSQPRSLCQPRSLSLRCPEPVEGSKRSAHRPDLADDSGSTLLLTIFYGCLSLVLVLLVVAATSLYLERKRLFTFADGAALAGAEAFELDSVTMTPNGPRPVLGSPDVAETVDEYVAIAPHTFENLVVERAETVDGRSATVQLSADWSPPVVSLLVPEGIRIDVTAVARSVFS